jgi:hypothetical protein
MKRVSLLMSKEIRIFISELRKYRNSLSKQVIKTLRGQALSGDLNGAKKGLNRILGKE